MWGDRNVQRVAGARFVSRVGGEAAFFVGIWGRATFEFGATPRQLALLMAVLGGSGLLGSALAGVAIDRFGPRRVLLLGELLFAPAILALILTNTVGQLTASVALAGLLGMVVITAIGSFAAYLTADPAEVKSVNAVVEVAGTAAFVAGPAAGAVLAETAGLNWIFVLDAATSLAAVALVMPVRTRVVARAQRHRALAELRAGFAFAYRRPVLRYLLLVGTLTWLSFGAFSALEPLFFREVLGTGPAALGWVNSVFGLGLVAGSLVLDRLPARRVNLRLVTGLSIGGGFGAILYTSTSDLRVVLVGAVYWGMVLGALLPALRTMAQIDTPDPLLGRVTGVLNTHQTVGELLPLTIMPVLAALVGVQMTLVAAGVVLAALSAVLLPWAGALDRGRNPGRLPSSHDVKAVDPAVLTVPGPPN